MAIFVPCDFQLQRAHYLAFLSLFLSLFLFSIATGGLQNVQLPIDEQNKLMTDLLFFSSDMAVMT